VAVIGGMKNAEVLIVGAGPAGLSLAIACAGHGVAFRIIDAAPSPAETSRALAVWSAAQEVFSAFGVVGRMLGEGMRPGGIRICTRHRTLLRIPVTAFEDSPYPAPLILPQSSTERILIDRLGELGHAVERSVELAGLEQDAGGVAVVLARPGGEQENVRFPLVVGCDGAHSTVRHLCGAKFKGRVLPQCFILCDAEVQGQEPPPREVLIHFSSKGVLPMFPIRENVWRIVSTRAAGSGTAPPTLEEMQEHLQERGPAGLTLANPEWLSSFRVSERMVDRFRHGRVLLAGDAAHIHSPAGGQGMNTGVQDAFNLGWKLGCIFRGGCHMETLLESYHAERAPVAAKVIADASARTRLAMIARGPLATLRNTLASALGKSPGTVAKLAKGFSGTDIQYPPNPLLGNDRLWHEDWRPHGFPPGLRIRDAQVLCDDLPVSLMGEVLGSTRHTLLVFSGIRPNFRDAETVEAIRQKAAGYSSLIGSVAVWRGDHAPDASWVLDPDTHAHKRFGAEFCSLYLLRPDGVVAVRSQPADFSPVASLLSQILEA
jgi:2-polyprenyl-6-methoxyphenol hydroxylase-like FAD-dependent oxidoreductase